MATYLKITRSELLALIETAETCRAIGEGLEDEAAEAEKAYKSVLQRNGLSLTEQKKSAVSVPNSRTER